MNSFRLVASIAALLSFATVGVAQTRPVPASTNNQPVFLDNSLVTVIKDVDVPAQEAGVLVKIYVEEGEAISVGSDAVPPTPLAQIEDKDARLRLKVADKRVEEATLNAEDDVNVRFAQASSAVAKAEHEINIQLKAKGAVSESEFRRSQLQADRGDLQIEVALKEQKIATFQKEQAMAEKEAVSNELSRRAVKATLNGKVEKLYHAEGEWVNPGDPIMRVVQLDELKVQSFIDARMYPPAAIRNRRVTIILNPSTEERRYFAATNVDLNAAIRDQRYQGRIFTGKVDGFSPLVEANGEYRVWAKVANRAQGDSWAIRPGTVVAMFVHVGEPQVTSNNR